ncbi:MAG: MmcQ/YjbR family DNA-binding protein [Myxococcales bacterium]|nr:MmcQ/YjbR family DNA-binding protein [Myxococcales bacterium]
MTTPPEQASLDTLRAVCFAFAQVEEKLSHGAPFFHVGGKGFAIFARDPDQPGRFAVWCKATPAQQRDCLRRDPGLFFVPPYVGVKGWVGVRFEHPRFEAEALSILLEEAWVSVAPKRALTAKPSPPPAQVQYPSTDPELVKRVKLQIESVIEDWPEVSVDEAEYGQTTWRVGARPFLYLQDNVHRDGAVAVCVRADNDEVAALVAARPKVYFVPKYMARRGWLGVRVDGPRPGWRALGERIAASYAQTRGSRG